MNTFGKKYTCCNISTHFQSFNTFEKDTRVINIKCDSVRLTILNLVSE